MSVVNVSSDEPLTKVMLLDPNSDFSNWSQLLQQSGCQWDVITIDDHETLLHRLSNNEYAAVFVPYDLKTSRKSDLLRRVKKQSSQTLRFQLGLAAESSEEKKVRQELIHRTFDKPTHFESICKTVEHLIKVRRLLRRQALQALISQRGTGKYKPEFIDALFDAVATLGASSDYVSIALEKDSALSDLVIKWVNSPFFGPKSHALGVSDIINNLRLTRVRGLIIVASIYLTYPAHRNWKLFSFERVIQRSMLVAQLAYDIAEEVGLEPAMCEQSYLAGLLQDMGILILASLQPAKYRDVLVTVESEHRTLHTVEKAIFGCFHGEVAAAFLLQWHVPPRVTEAVLFHSLPQLSDDTRFTPLTAVHVADTLLPSAWKSGDDEMRSQLSDPYLHRIAQHTHLHRWKLLATKYRPLLHQTIAAGK